MNDTVWHGMVWCGNKTTNKFRMAAQIEREDGRERNLQRWHHAQPICVWISAFIQCRKLHKMRFVTVKFQRCVHFIYWNSCNLWAFCLQCDWHRNEGKKDSNALFPCTGHYIDYHVSMHSAWMQRKQNRYSLHSKGKRMHNSNSKKGVHFKLSQNKIRMEKNLFT